MLDLKTPKYPIAFASELAKLPPGTGRSWVQHEWIKLARWKDRRAKKPGLTTLLSGWRVNQMAIAAEGARLGAHPKVACAAALQFTDFYSSVEAIGFKRDICELYSDQPGDSSLTLLGIYLDLPPHHGVVMRGDSATLSEVLFPMRRRANPILLLLDPIVRHVRTELEKMEGK